MTPAVPASSHPVAADPVDIPAVEETDLIAVDRRRPWRRVCAVALVAGPAIMAVGEVIHPAIAGSTSVDLARDLPGHVLAWETWTVVLTLGVLVWVPGLLRVCSAIGSGRGKVLAAVGAVLTVTGALGTGGFTAENAYLGGLVGPGPLDPGTAAAIQRADSASGLIVPTVFFFIAQHLVGPLVLGAATRARIAAHWQWIAAAVGILTVLILSSASHWFEPLGLVVLAVAFLPTARHLLRSGKAADTGITP